jgi:hypothetical protein
MRWSSAGSEDGNRGYPRTAERTWILLSGSGRRQTMTGKRLHYRAIIPDTMESRWISGRETRVRVVPVYVQVSNDSGMQKFGHCFRECLLIGLRSRRIINQEDTRRYNDPEVSEMRS